MPNKNDKTPDNVAGSYYVDSGCISCGQCAAIAGNNFKENSAGNYCVFKQPVDDAEKKACQEALDGCPVSAIGNDG
ncbi:MAG: ferredoxin [Gammaproteobacteria bacterium]|jgi:ferredoxin